MPGELNELAQKVANELLVWVGFGTLVGLLAKAIMPGRDPGGSIITLLTGIGGSIIGCGTLMFFWKDHRVTPISPLGFIVATAGAFMLLFFYRLLSGRIIQEGEHPKQHTRGPVRKRVRETVRIDD